VIVNRAQLSPYGVERELVLEMHPSLPSQRLPIASAPGADRVRERGRIIHWCEGADASFAGNPSKRRDIRHEWRRSAGECLDDSVPAAFCVTCLNEKIGRPEVSLGIRVRYFVQ
jgi:hypothetical protein